MSTKTILGSRTPLQVALAGSIDAGVFNDTAYYLFSRRLSDGSAAEPRVVYANSSVLKDAADYFEARKLPSQSHINTGSRLTKLPSNNRASRRLFCQRR